MNLTALVQLFDAGLHIVHDVNHVTHRTVEVLEVRIFTLLALHEAARALKDGLDLIQILVHALLFPDLHLLLQAAVEDHVRHARSEGDARREQQGPEAPEVPEPGPCGCPEAEAKDQAEVDANPCQINFDLCLVDDVKGLPQDKPPAAQDGPNTANGCAQIRHQTSDMRRAAHSPEMHRADTVLETTGSCCQVESGVPFRHDGGQDQEQGVAQEREAVQLLAEAHLVLGDDETADDGAR
mmetsp:Transcript_36053/g.92887  ORF Transcript_36053/g.92887 Transcript_36053/m.92887 type:complete len:239 (+) Transcript_36053:892-1608(+)